MDWVDDATTEGEELEPIWRERAMEVLGEDSEKTEELMKKLKDLVKTLQLILLLLILQTENISVLILTEVAFNKSIQ